MAWLATDKYGGEGVFSYEPYRSDGYWWDALSELNLSGRDTQVSLPNGTIKRILGHNLTWDDDPVEITLKKPHEKK